MTALPKRNETRRLGHTWCGHPLLTLPPRFILLSSFLVRLVLFFSASRPSIRIHRHPCAPDRVQLGRSWHTGQDDDAVSTSPRRDTSVLGMSGRVAAPAVTGAAELSCPSPCTYAPPRLCPETRRRVCDQLVLRIVQNTRNNLWTGHDDDWNIYSARYARCTLYTMGSISETDAVLATASVSAQLGSNALRS